MKGAGGKVEGRSSRLLDVVDTVDSYLGRENWRLRENSNLGYSFSSLFFRLAGEAMEKYTLLRAVSYTHLTLPTNREV